MESGDHMTRGAKDVILFAGQSGIKKDRCLGTLAGANTTIVSVEDRMKDLEPQGLLWILSLPPRLQEDLWGRAFQEILDDLPQEPATDKEVFISLHASYYHQAKTEFVCPADLAKLTHLKCRVRMIVVLIDDCYDIYRRLMNDGEMYADILHGISHGKLSPQDAFFRSIMNPTSILEWRQIEIAFSRKMAQLLACPLYIVAVKHPYWMIQRLIRSHDTDKSFYLSHPISSVRGGSYPRLPAFYSELERFVNQVLSCPNLTLFIPDAIDEQRIERERQTGRFTPNLLDGWPVPFQDHWLFAPLPAKVASLNPLNPGDFDFSQAPPDLQSAAALLLQMLSGKIGVQINSRDRSLVEQSRDGIVVYRPYWAGTTPGGVEEELKYNHQLKTKHGEKERRTAIFSTHEDIAKWRIVTLFDHLDGLIAVQENQRHDLNTGLDNLCEDWLNDPTKVAQFQDMAALREAIPSLRKSLEAVLPPDYEFQQPHRNTNLGKGEMLQAEERRREGWERIVAEIPERDPFSKYCLPDELDVHKFCYREALDEQLSGFIRQLCVKPNEG